MSQAIRLRVSSHDAFQLEFKIDYSLLADRKSRYTTDIYLFIPQSLDINKRAYSPTDFYRDAKHYVRLRTPRLPLNSLANSPSTPLTVCEEIIRIPHWHHNTALCNRLVSSLKVMRPVLNAALGGHVRRFAALARVSIDDSNQIPQVEELLQGLLGGIQTITQRYRALGPAILEACPDAREYAVYRLTDEAISLVVEDALVRAFRALAPYPDQTLAKGWQSEIARHNQDELDYRQAQDYATVATEGSENDTYLQRASLLKKFTISALFLTTSVSREGTTTEQFLYAVAAGLSMVFATVVAFYFQARFGLMTLPVFMALVVGYMFKDRIKEVGRVLFAGYMRRFYYDQRTVLRTSDGYHKLGYMRDKVDFVTQAGVPQSVLDQRHQHLPAGIQSAELEEEILHYSKQVLIDKNAWHRIDIGGLEITGLRDIMRYDVRPYLRQMASPLSPKQYLDQGELHIAQCHKTYQLIIVIEYGCNGKNTQKRRQSTIVCLDRNGILSVEGG